MNRLRIMGCLLLGAKLGEAWPWGKTKAKDFGKHWGTTGARPEPHCLDRCEARGCNKKFKLFTRRHHCRKCAQSICDACSDKNIPTVVEKKNVRWCKDCVDESRFYTKFRDGCFCVCETCESEPKQSNAVPKAQHQIHDQLALKYVIHDLGSTCMFSSAAPRVLGEGSWGVVFEAQSTDETDKNRYAVKVAKIKSEEIFNRTKREVEMHKKLSKCKYVLPLRAAVVPDVMPEMKGEDDSFKCFFVLDLKEKGNLFECLQTHRGNIRKLGVESAKLCFRYYLEVVAFAHKNNILLRDMKPENMLVDKNGRLWMCDFGCSKNLIINPSKGEERERTKSYACTEDYISPEMLNGSEYNHGTDLWNLGIILYELLAGIPPFGGYHGDAIKEYVENYNQCKEDTPPQLKDRKRKLIEDKEQLEFIEKLLHPDPTKRIGFENPNELLDSKYVMDKKTFKKYRDGGIENLPEDLQKAFIEKAAL